MVSKLRSGLLPNPSDKNSDSRMHPAGLGMTLQPIVSRLSITWWNVSADIDMYGMVLMTEERR